MFLSSVAVDSREESDISEKSFVIISSLFLLGSIISADLSNTNFRFSFIADSIRSELTLLLAMFSRVSYKIHNLMIT